MSTEIDDRRQSLLRQRLAGARRSRVAVPRLDLSAELPLSFGQRRLWFLDRYDETATDNLVPIVLRLTGPLDAAALGRAWDRLVERHLVLRTHYRSTADEPVQWIAPDGPRLELTDLADADDPERAAHDLAERLTARPLPLSGGAAARIHLLRPAADRHLLVAVFHHIAFDGWSERVFWSELSAFYREETGAGAAALPELPVQYAEYAAWQRRRFDEGRMAAATAYWTERLAGVVPLALPADRPRPDVRGPAGGACRFAVPADTADGVRALALEHGTTPFAVLLTAFQALLGRYTGRSDVAVGVPVGNRQRPELQDLIGFFVNTVVMRARWGAQQGFAELLQDNRLAVLDAFDHQELPFEWLVNELDPERDLSRTPLVQVMFGYQNTGASGPELPGVRAEAVETAWTTAKFDLNLQVVDAPAGPLDAVLEYSAELFDAATADRIAAHFLRLLASAVQAPDTPVAALEYLTADELHRFVTAPNDNAVERGPAAVHTLVAAQDPAAVAVVAADGSRLTFGELDARANRLARHLIALGAGPETTVGVHLDRGPDLVVALLAVLKSGAAYVPVDPAHPAERTAHVLADAGVALVLTSAARAGALPAAGGRTAVPVDAVRLDGLPATDPGVPVDPDSLAYVIYTSGTTGRPKGVETTHRGLANYLLWSAGAYAGAPGGTALFSSVAFDLVVPNLWTALMLGRPVTLLPADFDLADLGRLLLAAGPLSFLKLAPGHLEVLAGQLDAEQRRSVAAVVIAAGDSFTSALVDRWRVDGARLASEYGPTEITVGNSCQEVTGPITTELVPLGAPIPNTTAYVLDGGLRPVATGVVGEVYVGGTGVARGYRGRPGQTAGKFVPDPFSAVPGGRLYRTGDLARMLPGGEMEFVGRCDTQVKIRGYRVEPGEVQNVLDEHPAVRASVVVGRSDGPSGTELVAYVVADDRGADLTAFLAGRLPAWMVPSAVVHLAEIPLTSNGKTDHRALPAPGRRSRLTTEFTAPRPGIEAELAEHLRTVLKTEAVGAHDSFFELGGDSIRAVALVGALRAAGFDVAVRDVFRHRTVARLAAALGGRSSERLDAPLVAPFELLSEADRRRVPEGVRDAYPLSQVQLGMLFEMHAAGGEGNYHNVTSFRIRDPRPFSAAAFQAAVDHVVDRHEILRTSIDLDGYSEPIQLVHPDARIAVDSVDVSALAPQEQEAELRALMARERERPFELDRPPLLRFFTRSHRGGWWLTFTEFHPILEGWSFSSMIMEVLDRYRELAAGSAPEPQPLPEVRFADFVALERRALASEASREHWRASVAAHPKFTLPGAWGSTTEPPGSIQQTYVRFADLQEGLAALAARADVPLKSVMHAAHLKVMSMLTGEEAFSCGLVCDTRPEVVGADKVYGLYINTVPFPFRRGARTWTELVRQVFETEIGLWPHRRFPLGQMQREFAGGQRLADVYFNYLDFHVLDTELIDVETSIDDSPNEFGLSVTSHPGLLALISRPQDVSTENRERLGAMYRAVLEAMVADPEGDATAAHLPEGERELVLLAPNRTDAAYPATTLPDLFEAQVRRTPDAVAVVDTDGSTLSFRELDERVDRLAHVLVELGVGPERFVAVCLREGTEILTALLAVTKAGGAYVPIDPSHPADRSGFILDDTAAGVLVTRDSLRERFAAYAGTVLSVDGDAARIAAAPATAPGRELTPANLVYTLYTSGSTGRPKGVLITHEGLVNYLLWAVDGYGLDGADGAVMLGSVAFDLSVPNFFLPLIGGRSVTVLPPEQSPESLAALLAGKADYSLLKITPAHLDVLRSLIGPEGTVDSVRTFVVGADEVKPETVVAWRKTAPGARIINEYGPTETVVGCSVHVVPEDFDPSVPVPIGHPIANIRMYVLDAALQPVPVGVAGELYIGGAGVARGYLGRAALTAERFLPDPYASAPGARFYRTGDLARRRPDGELEFLGRIDHQVKIRGYRVELGEIEAVLLTHPEVAEAVVAAREDVPGVRRLVAYVVAVPGAQPAPSALRAHLSAVLPEYMVPAVFVRLDELPLSSANKVDRKALPAPEESGAAERAAEFVPPRSTTELVLTAIWAQVLGTDAIGVHDEFTRLGGDSITVVRMVAQAKLTGLDLTPRMAMSHQTVAELAAALDAAAADGPSTGRDWTARPPRGRGRRRLSVRPDDGLRELLADRAVPGVSVAVVDGGEVVDTWQLGVVRAGAADPVGDRTPFQVGSMSKPTSAAVALALAAEGLLDLDTDVAEYLHALRLRDVHGAPAKVTVRQLLGHSAGLPIAGFADFHPAEPLPALAAVLDGTAVAGRPALRVDPVFAGLTSYSATNFSVLQQVLADLTGEPFAALARRLVLDPLGLADSAFEQDLPDRAPVPVAWGHDAEGRPLDGGLRITPEAAAGGLWTTPADLARLLLSVRAEALGLGPGVLGTDLARAMLTGHADFDYGLGMMTDRQGRWFGHSGSTKGTVAMAAVDLRTGSGLAVTVNGAAGAEAVARITGQAARADRDLAWMNGIHRYMHLTGYLGNRPSA
ncbi:non-ribosomal peptide synthetase [Streptomyces sp. NRRL B-24484]|uniref:non-ribosomal peptide synthetase n=1 Tax=Streptomyces sp. NRRL B-24484 TaxID=1463833 RepID=UPI0006935110|nr:non-ribosomal peptide synthetase [Streptomyces sp. NRRL B-24484]